MARRTRVGAVVAGAVLGVVLASGCGSPDQHEQPAPSNAPGSGFHSADCNGVTDAGEVKTLGEWGISSIGLTSDGVAADPGAGGSGVAGRAEREDAVAEGGALQSGIVVGDDKQ